MDKEILAVLGIVGVGFGLLMAGACALDRATCYSQFSQSGMRADWGLISGCRVDVPGKGWIPADNYRAL